MGIISRYTFIFEDGDDCFIFSAESRFFSKIDKEAYVALVNHDLAGLDKESSEVLANKKIIIPQKDIYTYYYHRLTQHLTNAYASNRMTLIIAPTTGCNFECPYCFEPKTSPKSITLEVEDKIINYIKKREDIKEISITWYGGEPLLRPDAIRRIYDRIVEETDKKIVHQDIISNTYLVNDSVIEMMRHCNIDSIQVSLDGTEPHHDQTRYLKGSHSPTFKIIENNIEKLARQLPDMSISLRVNINKNNFRDFVDIYFKYQREPWHKNIWVYPGFIREDNANGKNICYSCYAASDFVDLYLTFAKMGVNVDLFPRDRSKGCMMQRFDAFIIGPEGELYKCWNDVSSPDKIIGSIMDNDRHNYDLLMKYMHECGPIREECRDCHVFPICGGGCGHRHYRNRFEGAEFELCSPFKDKATLKKALLYSIKENNNKDLKSIYLH